jgi:hypothetical protein
VLLPVLGGRAQLGRHLLAAARPAAKEAGHLRVAVQGGQVVEVVLAVGAQDQPLGFDRACGFPDGQGKTSRRPVE